jgi:hypothetical protein
VGSNPTRPTKKRRKDMKTGLALIEFIQMVFIGVFCFGLGGFVGEKIERGKLRDEAVLVGAAHYETDEKGNTKCVWDVKESVLTVTNRLVIK